jgi:hypothetical protein
MTVLDVLREVCGSPGELLIRRWNWKSSVFSSTLRALIFLAANLTAGWRAATGAMVAEFLYRAVTAGFYGALTQAFRRVEPPWKAGLATMILLPVVSHSLELGVHLARGTPKIATSLISSVCFTSISTLFNLYAMRRGVLVVDSDGGSIGNDLRRVPRLIAGFVASGPVELFSWLTQKRGLATEPGGARRDSIRRRRTPDRKCDASTGKSQILAP